MKRQTIIYGGCISLAIVGFILLRQFVFPQLSANYRDFVPIAYFLILIACAVSFAKYLEWKTDQKKKKSPPPDKPESPPDDPPT